MKNFLKGVKMKQAHKKKLFFLEEQGLNLIADPIHKYVIFTVPFKRQNSNENKEATEKDIIDTSWFQRLRAIHQLQNTIWVFPGGEHSRFLHSIGAMHLASKFAKQLYPSLEYILHISKAKCPSKNYIEEILRLAGLLHDIGHGPFGHFFDENFLNPVYGINHEIIGQSIIKNKLGNLIKNIRRSPSGKFDSGESINPSYVAYLIKKPKKNEKKYPKWLKFIRLLFSGIFTVDNLDYIIRDSYMCGISTEPIDIERLLYYTSFTENGITLHKSGIPALITFLYTKTFLYSNVYFHRTTRSFDLHLEEIFRKTMKKLIPTNPLDNLSSYMNITEWFVFHTVLGWTTKGNGVEKKLGREWRKILMRRKKWRYICEEYQSFSDILPKAVKLMTATEIKKEMDKKLKNNVKYKIDVAKQDTRPINPLNLQPQKIYIFDPASGISYEPLKQYLKDIPIKIAQYRLYSTAPPKYDMELASAFEKVLGAYKGEYITNI